MLRLAVEPMCGFLSPISKSGAAGFPTRSTPSGSWGIPLRIPTGFLVVGSDTLVDLHNWYRVDELLDLCEVATFLRPGESDLAGSLPKVELPERHREMLLGNVIEAHRSGFPRRKSACASRKG